MGRVRRAISILVAKEQIGKGARRPGGTKPVTAGITLFYDQGTKQYHMEKRIDPDSQVWVNFADLIQNRIPDKDGNVLPEDTKSGTYSIRVISHPLQAVLYEGKVITDKTYGHATYGCIICCGYDSTGFDPYSAYGSVDATTTVNAMGTNSCTNISQSINDFFPTWYPSDASIFTMATGSMTGVSVGTGTTNATTATLPTGGEGNDRPPYCPQRPAVNSGTGNVAPTITSISPAQGLVGAAASVTITGTGFASGATVNAGANISVSQITVKSSTQITATFTPTNSSSAGGNQGVTVSVPGSQPSNSQNFYDQVPTALQVVGTPVTLATGSAGGCTSAVNFGIKIDIEYQVLDQESPAQAVQSSAMTPYEDDTFPTGPQSGDTCPSSVADCTVTTASNGTYHDAPVGACSSQAVTNYTETQAISMLVGSAKYAVRTNNFTINSSSSGHGTISNGGDIQVTR